MPSKTQGIFPGMIIGYGTGTTPPAYDFCDGTNGTRDLRDKLIVGAGDTYALGNTGGALTHNHNYPTGAGGGGLIGGITISVNTPLGIVIPGGTMTLNAGAYGNASNLPSFTAEAFLRANRVGGVPFNGIVWWTGTTSNVPAGWIVVTLLYNKFMMGSGGSYNKNDAGGAATHTHTGSATGNFALGLGNVLLAGTDYQTSGTWSGSVTSSSFSLLPLYYGLIPIAATGTRGIYTGMVLPYDGLIANLPATYAEYTAARNRFIIGAGSTYSVGSTGGANSHSHASGSGGGSGSLVGGAGLGNGTGTKVLQQLFVGNVLHGGTDGAGNLPPYLALFYVIAL